ncbi:DMT family transporter [Helicobacter suis]|uniref:DMT family transporter n=1 Tax=Helicobacter suis TaxID=104628 RepID=UPI0013D7A1D9|nr:DMT family transporter [Helicobacter suis]
MNVKLGLLYMFLSGLALGIMGALMKIASGYFSPSENIFYRAFFMLVFLMIFYCFKPFSFKPYKKGAALLLLGRMSLGALGMSLFSYNIYTMSLANATAFNQSSPIFAIAIAFFLFKEPVGFRVVLAGLLGMFGVILISNPQTSGLTWVQIFPGVLNGLIVAVAYSSLHRLKEYYDGSLIVFAVASCMCLLGFLGFFIHLPPFATGYHPMRFSGNIWHWDLWRLAGIGLSGVFGQYFLTRAYMIAPIGLISPMVYSRLLWSTLFGILLGDPWPNLWVGIGMGLIVCSGVLIAIKKQK